MAKYFHISQGLRGCYMPDSSYIIRADTRRELKAALDWEARDIREAGFVGCNKRAVTWLAAQAWRNAGNHVVPYRNNHKGSGYAFGLFCTQATRAEYLDQEGV
jgi:hypothetical protein